MKPPRGSKELRKGRESIRGQYYLLTTKTYEERKIFVPRKTAEIVLESLHWLDQNGRIDLLAAVVMPNHLHFVAGLKSGTLSSLMHSLKSFSSKQLKQLLNWEDPIWQPQYHDHAIRNDEVLLDVIGYCLNNPVRAMLVKDFHDYPHWYCHYNV